MKNQTTMYDRADMGYRVGDVHPGVPRFALRHRTSGDVAFDRDAQCINDVVTWPISNHDGWHDVIDLRTGDVVEQIWI